MFVRPAGIGGRILGRGTGVVFGILERLTGVDLLHDLSVFFRALGGMIDGFTERARRVGLLLEDPGTTFLIVTAPRHDPVEEAIFFHRKLRDADMPFGGLVVNRLHASPDSDRELPADLDGDLARKVDTAADELIALAAREQASLARLRETLGDPPTIVIPELDGDVHDLDGLARLRDHLFNVA
jgi:anion-transporting  ArsA/GET3 family ATPase